MTDKAIIVIKFGGNALTEETATTFCNVVSQLPKIGFAPVIVHGGGPQIDAMLSKLNLSSHFVNGLRYSDKTTLAVAEMVLSGQVSKLLINALANAGVSGVGLSGKDGQLLTAKRLSHDTDGKAIDLGYVGEITHIDTTLLTVLIAHGFIPVIAPLARGVDGETYNINADFAAAAIAAALPATQFVLMTNIDGLLDGNKQLIARINLSEIDTLIAEGVIAGGMIPKTRAAQQALQHVDEVNIINGQDAEQLLRLLSGKAVGTTIIS